MIGCLSPPCCGNTEVTAPLGAGARPETRALECKAVWCWVVPASPEACGIYYRWEHRIWKQIDGSSACMMVLPSQLLTLILVSHNLAFNEEWSIWNKCSLNQTLMASCVLVLPTHYTLNLLCFWIISYSHLPSALYQGAGYRAGKL